MIPTVEEKIKKYIDLIVSAMGTKYTTEIIKEGDQYRIVVDLEDKPNSLLIGTDGDTLSSFQHIIRTLFHKDLPDDKTHFIIDIGRYRRTREDLINNKIPEMVSTSVLVQGMTLMVLGLSSYERLIVHKSLSETKGIQSISVGGGNNRKLVVMPNSESSINGGLERAILLDFTKVYD